MYNEIRKQQPRLIYLDDVNAPTPLLCNGEPYNAFVALRSATKQSVGYDYLGTLGDAFRTANQFSKKAGVAFYSIHKTGRAIDLDQHSKNYILEPVTIRGRQYFNIWLRVDIAGNLERYSQFYSKGETVRVWLGGQITLKNLNTNKWFNFTKLAESLKWERIPAWSDWKLNYKYSTKMEFWHYQYMWENGKRMTWQTAMDLLRQPLGVDNLPLSRYSIIRYGDNDAFDNGMVTVLQRALVSKGFLRTEEIDGDFRKITLGAVMAFQKSEGLDADGVVGKQTWDALDV